MTYNTPEIGRAAVRLLEAAGYTVELVDRKCCGRPMISQGDARPRRASSRVEHRAALAPRRAGACRSWASSRAACSRCATSTRAASGTDDAPLVAKQSVLLEEFLLARAGARPELCVQGRRARGVLLHGHCHQKALVGTAPDGGGRCRLGRATR